ncbi:MAG: 50S ribosomal protein L4 [Candidatus Wildermuthbacteria bacterium]|nr:50S ribosomal protein L4 [Candidatus Wildermuthbacteria bacterium]MBI2647936.1 50S ribosomal protein L4 [Candidatus Wildermuthbacteria bacterium]
MKIPVYDHAGTQVREAELSDAVFGVPFRNDLVHQVTRAQAANRRQGTAHTKDRSEVSGGGRKPWRQKGTGRARHGSSRSPLWVGGGVTFGPRSEKGYGQTIPKHMRRKALCMVLSAKMKNGLCAILEDVRMEKPDTKHLKNILSKLPVAKKGAMLILPDMQDSVLLSARNIPNIQTMQATDLNALDLLKARALVLCEGSVSVVEKTFGKKSSV